MLYVWVEKTGIPRLLEALEANEWESSSGALNTELDVDGLPDELGMEDDGFGAEAAQVEREMVGLKMAVQGEEGVGSDHEEGDGGDEEVQELENMILKMQAIKDMGADMPEAEKRKFAKRAVSDVMKTL